MASQLTTTPKKISHWEYNCSRPMICTQTVVDTYLVCKQKFLSGQILGKIFFKSNKNVINWAFLQFNFKLSGCAHS